MKKLSLGTAIVILSAGAAFAADLPAKIPETPSTAPAFTWTGFYAGIHGGYGWGNTSYFWPVAGDISGSFAPFAGGRFVQRLDGGTYGGHWGYNLQAGNWLLGLEASLDGSSITGHSGDQFAGAAPGASYNGKLRWFGSFTPRLGYARDNWLVYAKGGLAAGEIHAQLFNATSLLVTDQRNDHIGWTIGAGVEYALTSNWIFGLEYNYADLGEQTYGGLLRKTTGTILGNPNEYHLHPKFGTVLARLSYKPGEPRSIAAPIRTSISAGIWQGIYAGVHGGYGWGDMRYSWPLLGDTSNSFAPLAGGSFRQDLDGGVYGGHVGYNLQAGNWLLGLEASLNGSSIAGHSGDQFPGAGLDPGSSYNGKLKWFGSLTPRLGYARDNWLIYAKGGAAAGEVQVRLADPVNPAFPIFIAENKDHIGWTVGGGIEYAWTSNWIFGLEYNYYDLGSQTYGGLLKSPGLTVVNSNEYRLDPKFSTVLARLSYRFGG
jgi:opacity protein-like surface antigen